MQFTAIKSFLGYVPYDLVRYSDSDEVSCHEHCGVFIPLPDDIAKDFPVKKEDDSRPHITALCIGELKSDKVSDLEKAVERAVSRLEPFTLIMEDYGEFKNDEGKTIAHMKPRSKGSLGVDLESLHSSLKFALDCEEIPYKHRPGPFKPHATLAYLKAGKTYKGPKPTGEFLVDAVEIWLGDKVIKIPFGGRVSGRDVYSSPVIPYAESKDDSKGRWVTMKGARVFIENGKPTKGPASIVKGSKGSSKEAAAPRSELEKATGDGFKVDSVKRGGGQARFSIGGESVTVPTKDKEGNERLKGDVREDAFKAFNALREKWGMTDNDFKITGDKGGFAALGKLTGNKSGFELTKDSGGFAPLGNLAGDSKPSVPEASPVSSSPQQNGPLEAGAVFDKTKDKDLIPMGSENVNHFASFEKKLAGMVKEWGLGKIGFDKQSVKQSPFKQLVQSGFAAGMESRSNQPLAQSERSDTARQAFVSQGKDYLLNKAGFDQKSVAASKPKQVLQHGFNALKAINDARPGPQPRDDVWDRGPSNNFVKNIVDTFKAEFGQANKNAEGYQFFRSRAPLFNYASDKDGRWVTIGAQSVEVNGKKRKEGGTPVFIGSNGEILKGPSGMTGRKVSDLGKPEKKEKAKGSGEDYESVLRRQFGVKSKVDRIKGAIDAQNKGSKREEVKREPEKPDWSKTRSGGYKMGPWTLEKVKGKKNWTISKNGVVMKDLGRRATFDHAEGFIMKNGGPQLETSADDKKVSKWSKERAAATPKKPPQGGLHSTPKPQIKDKGGLHQSPKPKEPKRQSQKPKGGLHSAPGGGSQTPKKAPAKPRWEERIQDLQERIQAQLKRFEEGGKKVEAGKAALRAKQAERFSKPSNASLLPEAPKDGSKLPDIKRPRAMPTFKKTAALFEKWKAERRQ